MENQINEVLKEIEYVSNLFELLQSNVDRNLTTMWGALAFVIAASGAALFFLAKMWVNKSVESKLSELKKEIAKDVGNNFIIGHGIGMFRKGEDSITIPLSGNEMQPFVIIFPFYDIPIGIKEVTQDHFIVTRRDMHNMDVPFRYIILKTQWK